VTVGTVHYRQAHGPKTACGRKDLTKIKSTNVKADATCPECRGAIERYDAAYGDEGNYAIKHDMVGNARVRRHESVKRIVLDDVRKITREMIDLPEQRFAAEENAMRMKLFELRELIAEALPRRSTSSKRVEATPAKIPPAALVKKVTAALHTLGYVIIDRETRAEEFMVWMNLPKRTPKPDINSMSDEEYEKYRAVRDAEFDATVNGPLQQSKPAGQVAASFKKALREAGLVTTVLDDGYEIVLRGDRFEVVLPQDSRDIGAPVVVRAFRYR